jgi:methylmalonyl-CoA mutase N-terminal domain/subunit
MGGAVKAIEKGYIQQEVQESSYRHQREIESGKKVLVGVNKFQVNEPPLKGLLKEKCLRLSREKRRLSHRVRRRKKRP